MKSIQHQTLGLPSRAPVMFLSSVMLPQVMLPLYIFEPRYRAMLDHCLEGNRMFCVALMKPNVPEAAGEDDFFPIAGLGLLRACVGHPDGTSHLVLQGLARVQLRGFVQEEPFRIAELRELPSLPAGEDETTGLVGEIRHACADLLPGESEDRQKLRDQIAGITDPGILCDVVAHTFLRSPFRQQQVLEQLDVCSRLETVRRLLQEQSGEA